LFSNILCVFRADYDLEDSAKIGGTGSQSP